MPVETVLRISGTLRRIAYKIGKFGSFFILPLVFFTMWDVVIRKLGGGQIWLIENLGYFGTWFESTKLQEWEWHWHTVLFTLVLGYCYVNNRHVRVDLIRENLPFRVQTWIEFLGCSFFMIPFCAIVGYFASEYAIQAWITGEISASLVGLPYRWIIKSVLVFGLLVAGIAGISVWLQSLAVLLWNKGDQNYSRFILREKELFRIPRKRTLREWPLFVLAGWYLGPIADLFLIIFQIPVTIPLRLDSTGEITGTPNTRYLELENVPIDLSSISVNDDKGLVKFEWKTKTKLIYFAETPPSPITVNYTYKLQLMTLDWPEEQERKRLLRQEQKAERAAKDRAAKEVAG